MEMTMVINNKWLLCSRIHTHTYTHTSTLLFIYLFAPSLFYVVVH